MTANDIEHNSNAIFKRARKAVGYDIRHSRHHNINASIGFVFGAYMTETFRGAILSIPRGQIEAGISCGMTPLLVFYRITWPQMVRHALPSFTNNWLVLVKATALVSVIGLHDLVWNASTAGRSVREPFTFMFAVLVIYLILTAVSDIGLRWLGRRYSVGVRRT